MEHEILQKMAQLIMFVLWVGATRQVWKTKNDGVGWLVDTLCSVIGTLCLWWLLIMSGAVDLINPF